MKQNHGLGFIFINPSHVPHLPLALIGTELPLNLKSIYMEINQVAVDHL